MRYHLPHTRVKMGCFARGFLLLILSTSCAFYVDGCFEGYERISPNSDICVMVTPPDTWLEAFSTCVLPEGESSDPTSFVVQDIGGIRAYLRQQGISEVWLWPSDYKSLNNDVAQTPITWLDKLFYSFHLSRWKWATSSESECVTFSLTTFHQSARSCSPKEPEQKLSFVCILPQGAYETQTKSFDDACIGGAFLGFEFEERDVCYLMDDSVTERLAGKDYPPTGLNGRNFSHCEWLGGINQTELVERIDDECQSRTTIEYWTQTWTSSPLKMEQTTKRASIYDAVYKAIKTVHEIKNKTIMHLTKREAAPRQSSLHYDCLLCSPSSVEEAPSPSLQLQKDDRSNQLELTLNNFDSNETEVVTCFTDASLTSFTLPNYKMSTITISPLNMKTLTREMTLRKTAIEDSFFLRLRRNNTYYKHTPLHHEDFEMELPEFREGRNYSDKFLKISFNVSEEGNYWCVGQDYTKKRPIFTKKILVERPTEETTQLYLIHVEVTRKYDPILYCQKFGTIMARNLNITDANIELKRITSNGNSHLLLYHVTLLKNHTSPVGAVPKEFKFYVENTNHGLANITSVRKFSPYCPTTALRTFNQSLINLTSTLKGHRPSVVPVEINGTTVNVVYICIGDAIDGAVWKEIVPGDPDWKEEWNIIYTSRMTFLNITNELHTISKNPIESNTLPNVTDMIKVLLNQGEGSATSNGPALEDLEIILSELKFDPKGSGVVTDKRDSEVAILVSDLSRKNPVVGISLSSNNGRDTIVEITSTDRSRGVPADNSEVMVRLPENIASRFKRVAFAVFSNVQTFNSNTSNVRVNSRIVDIVLSNPGTKPDHTKLPNGEVIEIYFKPTSKVLDSESVACAFWDLQNAAWSTQGCTLDRATHLCRCNHLTHFAQIITGSGARLSPAHQKALEIISITGCTLSLLGLLVIVATGIVFKAWRQEVGNQVLLNLTAALALNLVTYLLVHSGVGGNTGGGCIFIGVVLHYSVLACFCWMLVMSGLQLVRLLTIVGNRNTSKLLLKSGLFAWGVPFIPIAILLIIGPSTYASTTDNSMERGFCYPTGVAFYTTVIGPVVCIIMVNLVAYIAILCRLFSCCGWGELKTGIQRHGLSDGVIAMRRIRILVFLFFLFGLTWTFAFLAKYIFFAYLFCITATLQGFVIFVFFFVIEHKSRGYWKAEFVQTSGKKNYKSSDTLSSVTYSTATHKTSESKSSWYIENVPLQNEENGSSVRIRNKERFAASLSQEEEPLKIRFSQQNIMTPEAFTETYNELAPLKGDSFEVDESVTPQVKTLRHTLLDTGGQHKKIMEAASESPKLKPSIEVKLTSLPSNKDDAIVLDSERIVIYANPVPPKRVLFADDERLEPRLEQEPIIPKTPQTRKPPDVNKDSLEQENESPKILHSPVEIKLSNWSGNKEDTMVSTSEACESESVSSSSGARATETLRPNANILLDNDDGLLVNNDNITIACIESNPIEDSAPVSDVQPTSNSSPKYQKPTPKEQSSQIPPAASTSSVASSNKKPVEQTNPMKRSPFIVSCPITRH